MSSSTDSATLKALAFGDVDRELAVTRRVLAALPAPHFNWKPHEKSMSLGSLALHVAALPDWARGALDDDGLEFATAPRPPERVESTEDLLEYFDDNAARLRKAIEKFDIARWNSTWTMRNGAVVVTAQPRPIVYRIWSMNHLIHHRAQLCVYLRLLDVPVPTVYFSTSDNPAWVFE